MERAKGEWIVYKDKTQPIYGTERYYFNGVMFSIPSWGSEAQAKTFNKKRDANKIAKRYNGKVIKTQTNANLKTK